MVGDAIAGDRDAGRWDGLVEDLVGMVPAQIVAGQMMLVEVVPGDETVVVVVKAVIVVPGMPVKSQADAEGRDDSGRQRRPTAIVVGVTPAHP